MKSFDPKTADAARQNLRVAIEHSGKSMREISLKIGKNASYIEQFIKRGSPAVLPELVRKTLTDYLQIEEHLISGMSEQSAIYDHQPPLRSAAPPVANVNLYTHYAVELKSGMLPLFSAVQGGGGEMLINNTPESWIDRPGQLRGISEAFALRVVGSSMYPKYNNGDIVLVNPNKKPAAGNYVVVSLRGASGEIGYIKQLVKIDKEKLTLKQFNPEKTLSFAASEITAICKVVGSMEGN